MTVGWGMVWLARLLTDCIEANHRGNTSRCLMECLSKWLSKADENVHPPTWQTLVNALRKLGAKAVAENIEKTSKQF